MRINACKGFLGVCLLLTGTAALGLRSNPTPFTDDFEMDWWTVDAGGDMWCAGGDFELSGTIAQPDAGAMTGGEFDLTGGFWTRGRHGRPVPSLIDLAETLSESTEPQQVPPP